MNFLICSEGCSGSGTIASALNSISSIYACHGHFPLDKLNRLSYHNFDYSPTAGHMMKNIFDLDIIDIFEYLSDLFPGKQHYGMVHSFTLDSLFKKHNLEDLSSVAIVNLIRDPHNVYLSSKNLIHKSLSISKFGTKEYIQMFSNILEEHPLIYPMVNRIDSKNDKSESIKCVISASLIAKMFSDSLSYNDSINTHCVEEITASKSSFVCFLDSIGIQQSTLNDINSLSLVRCNSHKVTGKDLEILTEDDVMLISYFFDIDVLDYAQSRYPGSKLWELIEKASLSSNMTFWSQARVKRNTPQEISAVDKARHIRDFLIANSSSNEPSFVLPYYLCQKIEKAIEAIDSFVLAFDENTANNNFQRTAIDSKWGEYCIIVQELLNDNILKIDDEYFCVPKSMGEFSPLDYQSADDFLLKNSCVTRIEFPADGD